MNCLQFFIFTRFFAVRAYVNSIYNTLWIAYNFLSLQGSLQWLLWSWLLSICCELLTIFYLYKVLCSIQSKVSLIYKVVNCLQFFIFTRFFAVSGTAIVSRPMLWIAYNFLSLQGSLQYLYPSLLFYPSCELLTIFYLYKVLCSIPILWNRMAKVVNCLQFFIFTRFFAVHQRRFLFTAKLWIAYNFLSLQGSLQ